MKNILSLLCILFTIGLFGQNEVSLKINHKFGADDFAASTVVTSYDGYNLKVERLEYYINGFTITHDGGMETSILGHYLINALRPTDLVIGSFDITEIESISFSVGVHPNSNHLDPSSYESAHPLAPKNPSMHWGWAAGYRFVALEGFAGSNANTLYEIHALGDDNYQTVTIPVTGTLDGNSITLSIDADCLGMYKGIDVSGGLITHGEAGKAITLLDNFGSNVFFAEGEIPLNILDQSFDGKFQISPNPSGGLHTSLALDLPPAKDYFYTVTDVSGKLIQTQKIASGQQVINLTSPHAGIYFLHLWKDNQPVIFRKWVVE